MRGIDGVARNRRQHLLVSSYHGDQEQQGALRAMRGRVDGLLVLSPYAESPGFLTDNLPQSLPTVLINTYLPGRPPGAEHRRPRRRHGDDPPPAGCRPPPHCLHFWSGPQLRRARCLRGFRDALVAFGSGAEGIELPGDFDEASGHRAGQELLAAGALPDAVFAANDMMALAACMRSRRQGSVCRPMLPWQVSMTFHWRVSSTRR